MGVEEELLDDEEADEFNFVAIGIAAVVVVAIIGGLVWFFVLKEELTEDEDAGPQLPQWEAPLDLTPELVYEGMDRLIINPADSRGRYYLVVKVDIAFSRNMLSELISTPWVLPQAQNIIIDVFSDYTIAELQKAELKEEARQEIKYEFNRLLGWEGDEPSPEELQEMDEDSRPPVKDIYLVEFILN